MKRLSVVLASISVMAVYSSAYAISNEVDVPIDVPKTRVLSQPISASQLTDKSQKPSEPWKGLDTKRYSDLTFYDSEGKTHLKGTILDFSPRYGFSTISIRTNDEFKRKNEANVCEIKEDGTFEIDLPIHHPQYKQILLGKTFKNLFLIPGDTLSFTLSFTELSDANPWYTIESFGFEGKPNDGVALNVVADSLIDARYGLKDLYWRFQVRDTDSMKTETYRNLDRLSEFLDSVVTDLPVLLGDLPISTFAKDCLSTYAVAKICRTMDDLERIFNNVKGGDYKTDENGRFRFVEGDRLDSDRLVELHIRHKELLYDNPLMTAFDGLLVPIGSPLEAAGKAAVCYKEVPDRPGKYIKVNDVDALYDKTLNRLDSIGIGNCFTAQLVRNQNIMAKMDSKTDIPSSRNLKMIEYLVSKANWNCSYPRLEEFLTQEFDEYEKRIMNIENSMDNGSDNSIIIDGSAEGDTFEKIIAPYCGNVLYLDFWGINCAPCHGAMIKQKPMIEQLADKPFKVLYIAKASERMDDGKKWLKSQEIKGEHIFVTDDDWNLLCERFDFSNIPYGVLVGKDGNILKTHYRFYRDEPLLQKALEE